jgi:hypothetical protein
MERKLPKTIGNLPFDRKDMIEKLDEFSEIYKERPIRDNHGGQLSAQLFYSWYVAKSMQPEFIIESGTYKGQGTWAFEQAAPNAVLICIDPYPKEEYKSQKAHYVRHDFSNVDWSNIPKEKCLVFFDDHQNALNRIIQCKNAGFKHLMFEDNYPEGQGDCMSLKKAFCELARHEVIPEVYSYEWLPKVLKTYHELPPIIDIEENRWGLPWHTYESNLPLLESIIKDSHKVYKDEMNQYTWINYVELK